METFFLQVQKTLSEQLSPEIAKTLTLPPDLELGDFSLPTFASAKAQGRKPNELAAEWVRKLTPIFAPQQIAVEVAGPYVNFKLSLNAIYKDCVKEETSGFERATNSDTRGTWLFEYSSPNVAKPFMIYHFRGTALGSTLYRTAKLRGYNAVGINHIGDWGTQFGKLFVANQLYRKDKNTDPTFQELVDIYVEFHKNVDSDPSLEQKGRDAFAKLENGDPEVQAFWKKCIQISMFEFNKIYSLIGVHFDKIWGESFYEDQLAPLLDELKKNQIIEESEGAFIAKVTDPQGRELPPCILQKSDGSSIYATRDLAAALHRFKTFNFKQMTYIVGGEQKLHFQQVFSVLRKMGKTWADRCEHVATGLYRFKDKKMSTRKGNFVTLKEVLEIAETRVHELMKARDPNLDLQSPSIQKIAEQVAMGALVFHDLHSDPVRDVEFDLEKIVDFEGETGPYLQYAYVRTKSLLAKAKDAGKMPSQDAAAITQALTHSSEILLLRKLAHMDLIFERCLEQRKATLLAHYLMDIAKRFSHFYRECPILNAESPALCGARLALVQSFQNRLGKGLQVLGIPLPEKM